MHTQCNAWCEKLKDKFPKYFKNKKVLEVGSAYINGSIRGKFDNCRYIGIDVKPHEDVDVVSIAHEFKAKANSFDVIYSINSLEHDMYFRKTLKKMIKLLKPGGLMFFSAASLWKEHGTSKHGPEASMTSQIKNWSNYYHNMKPIDIVKSIDLNKTFSEWEMKLDSGLDLNFWGIKK